MNCREFNLETDYEEVASWWEKHNWPVIAKELLSKNGLIVEHNEKKMMAIWVYRLQDSPFCIMEWLIGNPDTEWQDRTEAFKLITEEACNWAKKDGAKFMLSIGKHDRVIANLETFGFKKTDVNMTQLMRSL